MSNAQIFRDQVEAFARGDLDANIALFAEDAEYVEAGTGQAFKGRAEIRDALAAWRTAFPDTTAEVTNTVTDGDQVAAEVVWRGRQTGPLATPAGVLPPTGRAVEVPAAIISRFRDGRVQIQRQYFNLVTLLQQLGVGGPAQGA